jgi:hypothetical protein
VGGNPVQLTDPDGLHGKDKWYGYDDRNFQDWVHDEKQKMKRPGAMNFTKPMLEDMYDQWTAEGCPAGKGGKSGKGGQSRY